MKIVVVISRYLLGVIFTLFGFNGIFHFIPAPPPHSLLAVQFLTMMYASHFMAVVLVVQIVGGLLLLAGRFVPLALAILGPVLVNILNFHILMNPAGIGPGVLATVLWLILFWQYRANFKRIFEVYPREARKCKSQSFQPVNEAN